MFTLSFRPGTSIARPWLGCLGMLAVVGVCAAFGYGPTAWAGPIHDPGNPDVAPVGNCGLCVNHTGAQVHLAVEYLWPLTGWSEGDGWHGWWFEGNCTIKHGICVFVPKGGVGQMAQAPPGKLIDEIVRAAAERDVARLATLARVRSVRINSSRMSMQLVGCDGTNIVGHVPVDPSLLDAIAEAVGEPAD